MKRCLLVLLMITSLGFGATALQTPSVQAATSCIAGSPGCAGPPNPNASLDGAAAQICAGVNANNPGSGCTAGGSELERVITVIVNVLSIIVGVLAVIMIIFAGFRYVTSGGDSGRVSAAKNTLIYAIIGLVIVALAQFIVQFVLKKIL